MDSGSMADFWLVSSFWHKYSFLNCDINRQMAEFLQGKISAWHRQSLIIPYVFWFGQTVKDDN